MDHRPLSYVEKLENLYVLMETKQMLENKVNELTDHESVKIMKEDLAKINEEISSYTNGQSYEILELNMTQSLFNPAYLFDNEWKDESYFEKKRKKLLHNKVMT